MRRTAYGIINNYLTRPTLPNMQARSMGVNTAYSFPSPAGVQHAPDGTGKHVAQTTALCDQPNCETKKCYTPCGELLKMKLNGNYSHKQPQGKPSVFLDSTDYQGQQKDQYFVKAGTKSEITADQMKDLTENDMAPNKAATAYALQGDILDKIK